MKQLLSTLFLPLVVFSYLGANEIQHRFLAVDESRSQLHYVDQFDPKNDWSTPVPKASRDIQLIGDHRVLLSTNQGYVVYDLQTRQQVHHVDDKLFKGTASVRRLGNGHTMIGCNQKGVTLFELDPQDRVLKTFNFPTLKTMRLMRETIEGSFLLGSNDKEVIEANREGKILSKTPIEGCRHIYHILRKKDGRLLISSGYGAFVAETDPGGKIIQKTGEKSTVGDLHTLFYAGMQTLKNGHLVVCNWTGHGAQHSHKGPQLLEFDADGHLVWSWHDPERAGTIHGVIVLDGLNTEQAHDDRHIVLRPSN